MKSCDVLREAADTIGVKALAARLHLSAALVYKWCQESPRADPTASGARNPLDRIKEIYDATKDRRVINWICNEAGGFFVENPDVDPDKREEHVLVATQRVVSEFGKMLGDVSRSIANDGLIKPDEADDIRQSWEQLKATAAQFVVACERGLYDEPDEKPK